jgi:hypothetical protein
VPSTNQYGEAASPRRPLTGAAADQARRGAERRAAAAENLAQFASLAECIVQVLGVDLIRAKLGKDRALKVFALAGLDTERISAGWEATDPRTTQVSRSHPDQGYDMDPTHDPRVTQAVLVDRLPAEQVNQIQRTVAAEYAARRAAASARTVDRSDMGIPGVSYDGGVPVQRSSPGNTDGDWDAINHRVIPRARPSNIWAGDRDHQPEFINAASAGIGSNGMPAPLPDSVLPGAATAVLDGCPESPNGHHGEGKFCPFCGASQTGQQQD